MEEDELIVDIEEDSEQQIIKQPNLEASLLVAGVPVLTNETPSPAPAIGRYVLCIPF